MPKLTRRRILIGTGVAAGGLALGFALWPRAKNLATAGATLNNDESALNAWVKIARDDTVTVVVTHAEMGQGIFTALPQILAEELDADFARVTAIPAGNDRQYGNNAVFYRVLDGMLPDAMGWVALPAAKTIATMLGGLQVTGGSSSTTNGWLTLRTVGATARRMLVEAAAEQWRVPARRLTTRNSVITDPETGKSIRYGEIAEAAARRPIPRSAPVKDPSEFRLVGTSVPRIDIPPKVDGSGVFGADVILPDMLHAAVRHAPAFGGRLESFDAAAIADMPGVIGAYEVPTGGVAVVADSWWRANRALAALPVQFSEGTLDQAALWQRYEDGLAAAEPTHIHREDAGAFEALAGAATTIEATYQAPYLAHACMEPNVAVADVRAEGDLVISAKIWAPTQSVTLCLNAATRLFDLEADQVEVQATLLGGGFGRKVETDAVVEALVLSRAVGRPVKVQWSREEDMRHDFYRPGVMAKFSAGLDQAGKPVAWVNRIVGPSIMAQFNARHLGSEDFEGKDHTEVEGARELPFDLGAVHVDSVRVDTPVPLGYWRAVGHSHTGFTTQAFLDELALAAGQDPYQFRRQQLAGQLKHLAVLDKAAEMAGWGRDMPQGRGLGIALVESFESIVAEVAEIELTPEGDLLVPKVWVAVDCGRAIHPDTIAQQMESGVIFGLTAALYGKVELAAGGITQGNFDSYQMVLLSEAPLVETAIVTSDESHVGGIGEPGTPPIAAAVTNAIVAAGGPRLRRLPIGEQLRQAARTG